MHCEAFNHSNKKSIAMIKIVLIFTFYILPFTLFSQDLPDYSYVKKIPLEADGFSVWAEVYTSEKEIKTDDDKFYSWVKANIVHTTHGSYDGRLLHGTYVEYYNDNQLRQKGEFKDGLRTGEWKSWYENGVLKEKTNWKKGKRSGRFHQYNNAGEETLNGKFDDDKWNGKVHLKDSSGKDSTIVYENGSVVQPKVKKVKKSKNKNSEVIPLKEEKTIIKNEVDSTKVNDQKKEEKKESKNKKAKEEKKEPEKNPKEKKKKDQKNTENKLEEKSKE
jgi:hypothetical protein